MGWREPREIGHFASHVANLGFDHWDHQDSLSTDRYMTQISPPKKGQLETSTGVKSINCLACNQPRSAPQERHMVP